MLLQNSQDMIFELVSDIRTLNYSPTSTYQQSPIVGQSIKSGNTQSRMNNTTMMEE